MKNDVKLTIVYYSSTGTNYQIATAMKKAAEDAGAQVRLRRVRELAPEEVVQRKPNWWEHYTATRHIPEVSHDDLEWADAYIFGTPTRFGNMASQMKQFIDTTGGLWAKGALANKVVSGFTSASNAHGGQETTLMALYNMFYHWGAFIVPPGYTDDSIFAAGGNPYGFSVLAPEGQPLDEDLLDAARYQAQRVVEVAGWVKVGRRIAESQESEVAIAA